MQPTPTTSLSTGNVIAFQFESAKPVVPTKKRSNTCPSVGFFQIPSDKAETATVQQNVHLSPKQSILAQITTATPTRFSASKYEERRESSPANERGHSRQMSQPMATLSIIQEDPKAKFAASQYPTPVSSPNPNQEDDSATPGAKSSDALAPKATTGASNRTSIVTPWVSTTGDEKPPYSYATMIAYALIQAPEKKLTLSDIYKWISDTFKFYHLGEHGWQNSIRHNLSLNPAFSKIDRRPTTANPGKGCYWTIDPAAEPAFIENINRQGGPIKRQSCGVNDSAPPRKRAHTMTTIRSTDSDASRDRKRQSSNKPNLTVMLPEDFENRRCGQKILPSSTLEIRTPTNRPPREGSLPNDSEVEEAKSGMVVTTFRLDDRDGFKTVQSSVYGKGASRTPRITRTDSDASSTSEYLADDEDVSTVISDASQQLFSDLSLEDIVSTDCLPLLNDQVLRVLPKDLAESSLLADLGYTSSEPSTPRTPFTPRSPHTGSRDPFIAGDDLSPSYYGTYTYEVNSDLKASDGAYNLLVQPQEITGSSLEDILRSTAWEGHGLGLLNAF
ncbi:hypothetical protein BZG36_01899 [Bifiguratus adelaidae]|uniref:Fork-head domain-containing protein n=1 Tax=Bifiguratus adelaidae TaxID=1938954 RepID=A0A261Y4H7_9FUNG|nr:hypothetical protein BZG36_01899 [Bifiguratus adelaidae]